MRKICAGLYLFPQCAIYVQDLRKIVLLFPMRDICTYFSNVQYMRKIVLISSMHNICTRFAQDCTSFSIYAQDLHKIVLISPMCNTCARLYFFLQCAIYAQDLRKIVVISPVGNIYARFAQDCTYFSNAQYMRKI